MRNIDARLRRLEAAMGDKPIATIWWGEQSEAELQVEIAEQEAKGFRVIVARWLTEAEELAKL
jgi:hypothetical protein